MSDQPEKPAPAKDVGGRPTYKPSKEVRDMVQAMCVASLSVSMMAKIVGVDRGTFRAAFKEERKFSKAKLVANLVSRLYKHTEKSVPATIFALCNLDPEHWSNRHMNVMQHEGGDPTKPIKHTHTIRVIGGLPDPDGVVIDQPPPAEEEDAALTSAQKLLAEI